MTWFDAQKLKALLKFWGYNATHSSNGDGTYTVEIA